MNILSGFPVLNCQSIDETLSFYQQALQFVIVKKREVEGELEWVHLMNGSTTLMLQRVSSFFQSSDDVLQPNMILYFYINNIKEISHLLKVKYKINAEISIASYKMLECHISDPEGNQITLGQKDEHTSDG